MADETPDFREVWMGTVDTESGQGFYPIIGNVSTLATGTFPPKNTIGDYTKDAEDYISSLILSDLSGGMNVEDMNEGSDAARCWSSFMDTRRPGKIALPTLVETFQWSGATGTAYALGVVNDTFYAIIGSEIAGFNAATGAFYTEEAVTLTPVEKPTPFAGSIFVPCGESGYMIVAESATGNPTVTPVTTGVQEHPDDLAYNPAALDVNPPKAVAFTVFDQRLWALTTGGALAWSFTGADDTWNWPYDEARGWYPRLQAGHTPKRLEVFYGPEGTPRIVISTDRAVFLYNWAIPSINDTPVKFPPHPDFGGAMAVWRPGEDLWIGAGLDAVRYTAANVVVPMSGLARDDGMPLELWGRVVDLEPETSELYAVVAPVENGASGFEYSAQVGSLGTADGTFTNVRGIAVDGNGDVWAADTNNERIQRFSSALAFEAKSGSSGTSTGQFASNNGAWDCAVDGSDNVWVVDRGNHRVQKFNSSGTYQSQIDGTFTGTLTETFGGLGFGVSPNFNGPHQVAVDSSGNLYVADTANNRIVKIDSSGAYVSAFSPGGSSVVGVTVDSSGNIYVTWTTVAGLGTFSKYNSSFVNQWHKAFAGVLFRHIATDNTNLYIVGTDNVVRKYLLDGTFVTSWGSTGSGDGQFNKPEGIATDGTHVYVSEDKNRRVQKFTTSGTFVTKWGSAGTGTGKFGSTNGAWGVALDVSGDVWVCDYDNNRLQRFSNTGTYQTQYALTNPVGVAVTSGDAVWASSYTGHTVTRFTEVTNGAGNGDGEFNNPEGIAIATASGRVYVADTGNNRIQYFTSAGAYEGQWGEQGTATGKFNSPVRLAVHQTTGDVYVVDQGNKRVQQFDATGTFVRAWGSAGFGDGQFRTPTAIAVRPDGGGVWVADSTLDTVQVFSSSGAYLTRIGATGTGNGQFTGPSGLAFNEEGNALYVSDLDSERIQKFDFSESISGLTYPYLAGWTGVGWHGKWRGPEVGVQPNWAVVAPTSTRYDLWWGMDDGYLYRMKLRRYFHNPRQGILASEDTFAESGEIISSKFDAAMLGFWKIASHMVVFLEQASEDECVTIEYRIDGEQAWTPLGTVNSNEKTYLPFGVDADSGFSQGVAYNWIQFRIRAFRGDDATKSPLIKSIVFAYLKIPQNSSAYQFVVAFPKDEYNGRTAHQIREDLNDLVTSHSMIRLRLHEWDDDAREFRGYLTAVSGEDAPSDRTAGQRAVNFIELKSGES